mgnify:CR=1 FL=1
MDIRKRIKILHNGGAIDDEVSTLSFKTIARLEKSEIKIDDEKGHMFLTHMAMSLQRIKKGEKVEPLKSYIIDELQNNKGHDQTKEFINFVEKEGNIKLPESEKGYILLHLCNLIGKGC